MTETVYIYDGARTPFLRAKGMPGPFSASDLAIACGAPLLLRQPFAPTAFDEMILGCAMPAANEPNIGRVAALRLGLGLETPAWTVMRNCASGLQAIDSAAANIALGKSELVLAGGTDALSRSPLLLSEPMTRWFAQLQKARTPWQKAMHLARIPWGALKPVVGLLQGLTDPIVNLNMGQTAENLAHRFHIGREEADAFALQSHQKVERGQKEGRLEEIVPIMDARGVSYPADDGVRTDTTLEKLARLKPVFDRFGTVTAGNSSQITDGAALLVLGNGKIGKKLGLKPVAKIVDCAWAALDPACMGLGPVHAIAALLQKQKLGLADIDIFEINEAFAAQVLACLNAMQDDDYAKNHLGLDKPLGTLDPAKLNLDGGAIAIGHPVGASGARITLHLMQTLKRLNKKRGIASLCIGGGQGGAILLENMD